MRWKWWRGCVTIHIEGLCLDGFLQRAWQEKLLLMDLARPRRTVLTCRVATDQLPRTRALAQELGVILRVLSRRGLPALLLRAKARPALCVSLCLGLILAYAASCRIWEIRVIGADGAGQRAVLRVLAENGLSFGALREAQTVNLLEYRLEQALPQYRFVGIRLAGMRAQVTLAQGTEASAYPTGPCSLYAARDGVVEKITVTLGTARVVPGQAVQKGDLLIEGVLCTQGGQALPVTARGQVLGESHFTGLARLWVRRVAASEKGRPALICTARLGAWEKSFSLGKIGAESVPASLRAWRLPGVLAWAPVWLEVRLFRPGQWQRAEETALIGRLRRQSAAAALKKLPFSAQVKQVEQQILETENRLCMETVITAVQDLILEE